MALEIQVMGTTDLEPAPSPQARQGWCYMSSYMGAEHSKDKLLAWLWLSVWFRDGLLDILSQHPQMSWRWPSKTVEGRVLPWQQPGIGAQRWETRYLSFEAPSAVCGSAVWASLGSLVGVLGPTPDLLSRTCIWTVPGWSVCTLMLEKQEWMEARYWGREGL